MPSNKKSPWPPKLRLHLTASRHPELNPPGFIPTVEEAWARLGGTGPVPEKLNSKDEDARAMANRFAGARSFAEEPWNALLTLWLARADWSFVFARALSKGVLKKPFFESSPGGALFWTAVRRHAWAASDASFAEAWGLARPIYERLLGEKAAHHAHQRDFMAFAFDRAGIADAHLRRFIDKSLISYNTAVMSACTDADLVDEYLKGRKPHPQVDYVFDLVESIGARAAPVLSSMEVRLAGDKKRVADALAIAKALK